MVGAKVLGKCLSRLETSELARPFLQLYFLMRLILSEIEVNSCIMLGKAFCGNGFIHLNIAEIYERIHPGARKHALRWAIRAQNECIHLSVSFTA